MASNKRPYRNISQPFYGGNGNNYEGWYRRYSSNLYTKIVNSVSFFIASISRKTFSSKRANALYSAAALISRKAFFNKQSSALSLAPATVTKKTTLLRFINVTATWPVNASKTYRFIKKVTALANNVGKFFSFNKIISHPGQVGGSAYVATLGASIEEPSVSAQAQSPTIGAQVIFSE
jgi:hypothetical protein